MAKVKDYDGDFSKVSLVSHEYDDAKKIELYDIFFEEVRMFLNHFKDGADKNGNNGDLDNLIEKLVENEEFSNNADEIKRKIIFNECSDIQKMIIFIEALKLTESNKLGYAINGNYNCTNCFSHLIGSMICGYTIANTINLDKINPFLSAKIGLIHDYARVAIFDNSFSHTSRGAELLADDPLLSIFAQDSITHSYFSSLEDSIKILDLCKTENPIDAFNSVDIHGCAYSTFELQTENLKNTSTSRWLSRFRYSIYNVIENMTDVVEVGNVFNRVISILDARNMILSLDEGNVNLMFKDNVKINYFKKKKKEKLLLNQLSIMNNYMIFLLMFILTKEDILKYKITRKSCKQDILNNFGYVSKEFEKIFLGDKLNVSRKEILNNTEEILKKK